MQNTYRVNTRNDLFQILLSIKTNRKKRAEHKEIFIEGIEPIRQAVAGGWHVKRILSSGFQNLSNWGKEWVSSQESAQLLELPEDLFAELSDKETLSEILVTVDLQRRRLSDIQLDAEPFILILDRPSDLGNLGSIIRSANAFGVHLVVINGHGADPFDPKAIRASLGAVFRTPIVQDEAAEDLEFWLNGLKQQLGLEVVGTDSGGESPIAGTGLCRPIAVILGNEAKGMSVRLKTFVDRVISIPMVGEVNSLNVACAGSILLWTVSGNAK